MNKIDFGQTIERLRPALKWGRYVFGIVALLFMVGFLYFAASEEGAVEALKNVSIYTLAVCVSCIVFAHFLVPLSTHSLFQKDSKLSYEQLLYYHCHRLPARYLPGGIWQTVAKNFDYANDGVVKSVLVRVLVLEIVVSLGSAIFIGGLFFEGGLLFAILGWLGLLTVFLMLFLVQPNWMLRGVNVRFLMSAFLVYCFVWFSYSFAFGCFVNAILVDVNVVKVMGGYLLSWVVGYIAIFSPQGIGVQESVFAFLGDGVSSFYQVASVAFLFRFVVFLADVFAYMLSFLMRARL